MAPNQAMAATDLEAKLLTRLGLPRNASIQQVETAHEQLIGFLEAAPVELRPWADREIDAIDEAYALLADPTIDRSSLLEGDAPSGTVAAATPARTAAVAPPTQQSSAGRPDGAAADVQSATRSPWARRIRRIGLVAAAVVGIGVIALVGYNMGGPVSPGPAAAQEPDPAAGPAVDTARVGELMKKIEADPRDVASLQALADIWFSANEFDIAGGFLEKILEIDSKDLTARLALGAAQFNVGRSAEAEENWRKVLAIDPDNVEAHYDLGFLYLTQEPADVEKAKAEWGRVVEIAPGSKIAQSVEQHLASLVAPSAAPSSGPSVAPSSGQSAAPSGN